MAVDEDDDDDDDDDEDDDDDDDEDAAAGAWKEGCSYAPDAQIPPISFSLPPNAVNRSKR